MSANAIEIYRNTIWSDTLKWKGIDLASGTGVIWGNTITGPYQIPIGGIDYKSSDPRTVKLCDGTDPADQNVPGQSGWHCQYQLGSHNKGANAVSYPLYLWDNIIAPVPTVNGDSWTQSLNGKGLNTLQITSGANHVKSGRDFFNGINRPGYQPYTYPHPLVKSVP